MTDVVVTQERFDYKVTAVDTVEYRVEVTGFLRVVDNAALRDTLASQTSLPGGPAAALLADWSRYLEGEAVFDVAEGSTREARGIRVPFGFLRGASKPVAEATHVVHYALVRS